MHGDITIYRPTATGELQQVGIITMQDSWERALRGAVLKFGRRLKDAPAPVVLPPEQRVSPYKYVHYFTAFPRWNCPRWRAQPYCARLKKVVHCGCFHTPDQAARAAARYLNVSVEELRK